MKAIILAAGKGTRLADLTIDRPKPLLKIHGLTILEMQLSALLSSPLVEEVLVVTGYLNSQIETFIRNSSYSHKVRLIFNDNYESTNNMYSLFLAREEVDGMDFILCNGDVAFLTDTILRFEDNGRSEILTDFDRFTEDNMKVLIDSKGFVRELSKSLSVTESQGVSLDLYKFNSSDSATLFREIEGHIQQGVLTNWTEVAIASLCRNHQVQMEAINIKSDSWYEIDNLQDLRAARKEFIGNHELENFERVICDLDGTLLHENVAIEGAAELLNQVSTKRSSIYYLTNNSSYSDADHIVRLKQLGFPVGDESIISSTRHTILFLSESSVRDIYLFGTESVSNDFLRAGFNINSSSPEIVVVCNHTQFTYFELSEAIKFIHRGVPYVLTHQDISRPTPNGPMPDAGSVGLLIQELTSVPPSRILGKPSREILELIPDFRGSLGNDKNNSFTGSVIIGDRLELDVKLGLEAQIFTVLVLSGSTSELEFQNSALIPNLVLESITDFL